MGTRIGMGVLSLLWLAGTALWASPEIDNRFAFKYLVAAVVNADRENVHGAHVQAEMQKFFAARTRFGLSETGYQSFQQTQARGAVADITQLPANEISALLASALASGADSAVLAQVQKLGEDYQVAFLAVVLNPVEIVYRQVVKVADKFSLHSFGAATVDGLSGFVQSLPFDASIISREGYRVVLDRGAPSFKQGTRIAAYTLDKDATGTSLKETGVILLNRVDRNLSFGTILVENRPLEITKGNKVRFQSLGTLAPDETIPSRALQPPVLSRDIASTPNGLSADYIFQKSKWGVVDVHLAGNFVSWNRTSNVGTYLSESGFYPGAAVRAEVKLTRDMFAEASGFFGLSTLTTSATGTPTGLGSQTNQMRAQVGYRLGLHGMGVGPSVHLRAGFSRTQYQVDDLPTLLAPSSAVFSGIVFGGGLQFPFTERFGIGLDMAGLLFGSVSEGGGTSGAMAHDITGWDFAVRAYYHLNESMNIDAKMVFQSNAAEFDGVGTRTVPLSSLSQTSRAFMAGLSYYY